MPSPPKTIQLAMPSVSYDITVGSGLLASLHPRLLKLFPGRPLRLFLVTSPNIWKLWSATVRASFPEAQSPTILFMPPGEKYKRLSTLETLADQMAAAGADRDSILLAFGGGVIGDLTGYLASSYMRGIPYVHIPTTLLAQIDSSIGGKTGVNLAAGKNLLGSFYHPKAVLADVDILATLPSRELCAGMQEAVKAGIILDLKLFAYLERKKDLAKDGNASVLTQIIAAAVAIKAGVVTQDERESGRRMILNFGHTLGHAIEAATRYKVLLHGEAVGWGSIAALHLGLRRGSINAAEFARMANLILAFGPLPAFRATALQLVALTATDKKSRSGRRAFVLPTGVGSVEIVHDVTDEELTAAAQAMLSDMKSATKARP